MHNAPIRLVHAIMHAVTLVVVLISAGVISRCTSRWVSGWVSPHSSSSAARTQRWPPSLSRVRNPSTSQPRRGPPRLLSPSAAAARICTLSGAAFGVAVARLASATVCHAHWSATRPEQLVLYAAWDQSARVGLALARGTFTAAILHTKWDLTGHTRRPSKRSRPTPKTHSGARSWS